MTAEPVWADPAPVRPAAQSPQPTTYNPARERALDDERERRDLARAAWVVAREEERRRARLGLRDGPRWALVGPGIGALALGLVAGGLCIAASSQRHFSSSGPLSNLESAISTATVVVPGVVAGITFVGGTVLIGVGFMHQPRRASVRQDSRRAARAHDLQLP